MNSAAAAALPLDVGSPVSGGWQTFRRWILTALFMVGIPGCFGFFLLDELERTSLEDSRRAEQDDIREVLGQVATRGSLQRRFGTLFDRLAQLPWTARQFAQRIAAVQRADPKLLDVFVFDAQGIRVSVPGCADRLVVASQQFMQALMYPEKPRREKLITAFAGNAGVPDLMAATPGTLVELLTGGANTWGGWWQLYDRRGLRTGHVVVFVHRESVDADDLLDRAVEETNRLLPVRFVVGWRDPLQPDTLRPRQRPFPQGMIKCLDAMPIGNSTADLNERTVAVYQHEDGPILFGVAAEAQTKSAQFATYRLRFGAVLVIALVILVVSLHRVKSLRSKLLWQLAIAGGFPLAILLSTVFVDRQDRESLLQRLIGDRQLEFLAGFDGNFTAEMLPILRTYARVFDATRRDPTALAASFTATIRRLLQQREGLISQCTIVDARGKTLLFERYARGGDAENQKQSSHNLPAFAYGILQNVNCEVLASGTTTDGNPLVGAMVQNKFANEWLAENNILRANTLGKGRMLSFFRLYPGRHDDYTAIFVATHDPRKAQVRFLSRQIGTAPPKRKRTTRLLAIPVVPGGSWPAFPSNRWGSDTTMRKLRDLVLTTGIPQCQTVWLSGERFLASALRGHFLDGYVLVLLRPYVSVTIEGRRLTQRAVALAGFMLLFTLLVAWTAARFLLRPLGALGQGLAALEARNFKVRVEPGQLAELAHVARRFNLLLESLGELEMARSVQETLWPAHGKSGPGWSVDGRCVTAAALGGDFYDWFVLADGRLVVAVGDVAGHGIPSAFVAAAAKVELAMNAEVDATPGRILEAMNIGLTQQAGRKRPMSFWVGVLDPTTGTLQYGNAGQSFPIAMIGNEGPRMIEGSGYPLASRRKSAFSVGAIDLGIVSRICLYTDGLIEARSADHEPFDYSRLMVSVESARHRPIGEAIDIIFTTVQNWSGVSVPDDDQTLVVLNWERPA